MIVKLLILVSAALILSGKPEAVKIFRNIGGLVGRAVGAYQGLTIRATQFSSSPELKRFQEEYKEQIEDLAAGMKGIQDINQKLSNPRDLVRSSIFSTPNEGDKKQNNESVNATAEEVLDEVGIKMPVKKINPVLSIPIEVINKSDGEKKRRPLEFYDLDLSTSNAYRRLYTKILECNFAHNQFGVLGVNSESSDVSSSSGESARFRKDYDRQSFDYAILCLGAESISKAVLSGRKMKTDLEAGEKL